MDTLTPFMIGQYKIITIVNNCISSYFVEEYNRAANKLPLTANQSCSLLDLLQDSRFGINNACVEGEETARMYIVHHHQRSCPWVNTSSC